MKCYIVDAFTKEIFKGNPAAVCVLDQWLPDELMQHIAMENSLSETAGTAVLADDGIPFFHDFGNGRLELTSF